jgi:DNA invertase Pin-like site-specific DNA recombinase
MRVAGYVRVSTEQQRDDGSHERQAARLRDWAESRQDDIDIFEDIAISGQDDTRESYRELMGDPAKDDLGTVTEYDAVAVREMSRFGRSLQQVTQDIERLHDNDVDFVSLKEDIDMTTAQGKLMLHIIAAFNQFWSDWSRQRALEYAERAREDDDLQLGRPKKLSPEQLEQVYEWNDMGLSYSDIATLVDDAYGVEVDKSTIYRYCKEQTETSEAA